MNFDKFIERAIQIAMVFVLVTSGVLALGSLWLLVQRGLP